MLTDEILPVVLPEERLLVWAAMHMHNHTPSENTYGMSCEDMGCYPCNVGTGDFVADGQRLLDDMRTADATPPDDGGGYCPAPVQWPDEAEIVEAIEEYLFEQAA